MPQHVTLSDLLRHLLLAYAPGDAPQPSPPAPPSPELIRHLTRSRPGTETTACALKTALRRRSELWGWACALGEADTVAFCGVAEVTFVVVAEALVEPLGYSGGVQAGTEHAVLHVPCDVP